MPDNRPLSPADPVDLAEALAFALTHNGRKRFRQSQEYMAIITAKHLVAHLESAGYVVMKRPPMEDHSTPPNPHGTKA